MGASPFRAEFLCQQMETLLQLRAERVGNQFTPEKGAPSSRHSDLIDAASDDSAVDVNISLAEHNSERAKRIDVALDKIRQRIYGICDHCGKKIVETRLKALPLVEFCFRCQSDLEKQGGAT